MTLYYSCLSVLAVIVISLFTSCASQEELSQPEKPSYPSMVEKEYKKYQNSNLRNYRALAYNSYSGKSGRSWFTQSPKQAIDVAMSYCEKKYDYICKLYALGDFIVDGMETEKIMEIAEEYYTNKTWPELTKTLVID